MSIGAELRRRACQSCLLAGVGDERFQIARRRRAGQHVEYAGANRVRGRRRPIGVGDADDDGLRMLGADGACGPQGFAVLPEIDDAQRHLLLD